jgi:nicotinamidase-related amidase
MELSPSSTAVIAVHMQPDIVSADGAFGPFFAAQAAEHDVVGVIGKLQDAARGAGVAVIYTRVAWKSDYSDLNPNSPLLGMVVEKLPRRRETYGRDCPPTEPTGRRRRRHSQAGKWLH